VQALLETLVEFLRDVVDGTLGPVDGRRFLPFIGTIFLFIWTSNLVGLVPTGEIFQAVNEWTGRPEHGANLVWEFSGGTLVIPGAIEPTRNVNFPWGLGIMVFFLMHILAIKRKGMARYLDEYFQPHLGRFTWPYQKWWARIAMAVLAAALAGAFGYVVGTFLDHRWASDPYVAYGLGGALGLYALAAFLVRPKFKPKELGVPNLFIAPLNIIGKFAEILSMSFRLFGNIFGGAVIFLMIASTIKPGLPILLQVFFGLFVGTVQAFVFTVLSLTYLAVEIREEEEVETIMHPSAHEEAAPAA
ncbi:MAG TPA: F0F1 ATP synthase subunit A, partial [Phycisphaerae bacterium]|nr:F0F1 ATP synthase subunit A [Phycisphaerae bacterium]